MANLKLVNRIMRGVTLAMLGLAPSLAYAQGASNLVRLSADRTQTQVQVGAYYTQVMIRVEDIRMPNDDNGKKQLGKAILSAFSLNDKTRALTISAVLTRLGQSLPEIPIITYSFDGKRRITNYQLINNYVSPRWQLGAGDTISVSLNYKFSEQVTYDAAAINNNVTQLIPSDAIVSALGAPFVQSVARLAASVFETAGTRTIAIRNQDDLLPYPGAVGARSLIYSLALADGTTLGTIKASLVVSPTLVRPAYLAIEAQPSDLVRRDGENVADLAVSVGGANKKLLQEVQGLPPYAALTREPTPTAVRDFCVKANDALGAYGLTTLDRITLEYAALLNAGFDPVRYHPTANSWRSDCFASADQTALTRAMNINFTPVPQPLPPVVTFADQWTKPLKSAFGCWITGKTGEWCQKNAPDARTSLLKAMVDRVQIGVVDLPGIDVTGLPIGRMWSKTDLLSALSGKADDFGCYELGLIVIKDGQPYSLGVELKNEAVISLQLVKAAPEASRCLSS